MVSDYLAFSLPIVTFTHIPGAGFITEHGSVSPAVLSWSSERNAHFYVPALTTVIEPLVQLPRSCPCSREGCAGRSGASRAVILSLCWVLMKLCLKRVSVWALQTRKVWMCWRELSERPGMPWRDWSISPHEDRLGAGTVQPAEEEVQGDLTSICGDDSQTLLNGAQ